MAVSFLLAKKRNYPKEPPYSFQESIKIFIEGILPMFTIVIVLGGIIWALLHRQKRRYLLYFMRFFSVFLSIAH
jgi:TRAP-type C4-dicarboxylate transport system permease large subunit